MGMISGLGYRGHIWIILDPSGFNVNIVELHDIACIYSTKNIRPKNIDDFFKVRHMPRSKWPTIAHSTSIQYRIIYNVYKCLNEPITQISRTIQPMKNR